MHLAAWILRPTSRLVGREGRFCAQCGAPFGLILLMESEKAAPEPMSPAHLAVEHGDVRELTRLLDAGTDPNEMWNGWTLLAHAIDAEGDGAAQTGEPLDAACTAVLLAYGADPELPCRDGTMPMPLAVRCGHAMAARLIEAHIARRHGGVMPTPTRENP